MHLVRFCLLLIMCFALGCGKTNLSPSPFSYDLIVEGGITTYGEHQFIRLTKPVLFPGAQVQPISGALVSVFDGTSSVIFREVAASKGTYTARMSNNKNYNDAYTLTIIYEQKQYTATDTLYQVFPISDRYIPLSISVTGINAKIIVPKHTFGTLLSQQWLIAKSNKSWDPGNFDGPYDYSFSHLYGSPDALNPLLSKNFILKVNANDSLEIYKFGLSGSHSNYLYNLFQETDWRGILSSAPANVKGNISGNAAGFFYATDVEQQKKSIPDLIKQNR